MIDARTLFAKAFDPDLFAQDPQKAMDKLTGAMKKGQVKAKDLLPKVYKLMHDTYGPVVEKGINNVARQQERFNNNLAKFKNIIFMGGLERGVSAFYGGISELLVLLKPLAAALGGVAEGLGDVFYYFRLGVAYIKDWMVQLGFLDFKTNEWKNDTLEAWSEAGQAIGWVLGVLLTKKVFGFIRTLGSLLFSFGKVKSAATELAGVTVTGAGMAGFLRMLTAIVGKLGPMMAFFAAVESFNKLGSMQEEAKSNGVTVADIIARKQQGNKASGEQFTGGITDWFSNAWRGKPSIPTANSMSPTAYYQPQAQMQTQGQYGGMSQPKVDVNVNLNEGALKDLIDVRIDYSTSNILNDINSSYPNK